MLSVSELLMVFAAVTGLVWLPVLSSTPPSGQLLIRLQQKFTDFQRPKLKLIVLVCLLVFEV